ncbi:MULTISPECIES: hypothetical protein [unclassified Mameliella]|uniref:hypothetical protein n=1 Tax=unclassified Mameliella TaxID=2630630 RepID=UPI00273E54CA|nr:MULTISPECIES: hypothetical protein [unclassified Mameliella]
MTAITENFSKGAGYFQQAVGAVSAFFDSLARATAAAEAYDHYSNMSDAQLAEHGLDRMTVGQHIMHRHLDA